MAVLARLRVLAVWLTVAALVGLARPTAASIAAGVPFVACGEILRVWAAGHLTKTVELALWGPYRFTRNPLYLGRLAIFTGLCLMSRLPQALHLVLLAGGWAVFFVYYLPRKERVEPARLLAAHGAAYRHYRDSVPALFPALRPYPRSVRRAWSVHRALANREHWMAAGVVLAVAWLVVRAWAWGRLANR